MITFQRRKEDTLKKTDKSSKQSWDKRIISLCNSINKKADFYTTSSCSGRVILIKDASKKQPNLFLFTSHDPINYKKLKQEINKVQSTHQGKVTFKLEPAILHLATKDLTSAQNFLNKAKLAGWKKGGIISSNKRYIIELSNSEKLEFPIINQGKTLVSEEFLKIIVKDSNNKLKKSWEKIKRLKSSV